MRGELVQLMMKSSEEPAEDELNELDEAKSPKRIFPALDLDEESKVECRNEMVDEISF